MRGLPRRATGLNARGAQADHFLPARTARARSVGANPCTPLDARAKEKPRCTRRCSIRSAGAASVQWLLGHVIGVAVDSRDHIRVLRRPRSLTDSERGAAVDPPTAECCVPAPAVIEFDQEGNVVQAWGGPGDGYEWPTGSTASSSTHSVTVDSHGNVYVGETLDGRRGQKFKPAGM